MESALGGPPNAAPNRAAASIVSRGDRAIELTLLLTGSCGGILQLTNHEAVAQRVEVRLPGRRLRQVRALGDGGQLLHRADAEGTSIQVELQAHGMLALRLVQELASPEEKHAEPGREAPPGRPGSGAWVHHGAVQTSIGRRPLQA